VAACTVALSTKQRALRLTLSPIAPKKLAGMAGKRLLEACSRVQCSECTEARGSGRQRSSSALDSGVRKKARKEMRDSTAAGRGEEEELLQSLMMAESAGRSGKER
jgi:hypothetical protein